jgi:hypothetical protein
MLPAPVAEGAQPGVVERVVQGAADRLAAAKEQIFDGGAQLKQHATAAVTHYRPVDPTPLAAARPGTVAAVVASCLTIGGGAAAYCVGPDSGRAPNLIRISSMRQIPISETLRAGLVG